MPLGVDNREIFGAERSDFEYSTELAIELFDNIPPLNEEWSDSNAHPIIMSPETVGDSGFEVTETLYSPNHHIINNVQNKHGLVDTIQLIKLKTVIDIPEHRLTRFKRLIIFAPEESRSQAEKLVGNQVIVMDEASQQYPDLLPATIETGRFKTIVGEGGVQFLLSKMRQNGDEKCLTGLTNLFLRIIEGKTISRA